MSFPEAFPPQRQLSAAEELALKQQPTQEVENELPPLPEVSGAYMDAMAVVDKGERVTTEVLQGERDEQKARQALALVTEVQLERPEETDERILAKGTKLRMTDKNWERFRQSTVESPVPASDGFRGGDKAYAAGSTTELEQGLEVLEHARPTQEQLQIADQYLQSQEAAYAQLQTDIMSLRSQLDEVSTEDARKALTAELTQKESRAKKIGDFVRQAEVRLATLSREASEVE